MQYRRFRRQCDLKRHKCRLMTLSSLLPHLVWVALPVPGSHGQGQGVCVCVCVCVCAIPK